MKQQIFHFFVVVLVLCLIKMPDPSTGYVYHKVVTQRWAENVLPEFDTAPRWIVEKTTHDTGKFAAVMVMAA